MRRKWRTRCATTLNGTHGTSQVASTTWQGVAANVADYHDISYDPRNLTRADYLSVHAGELILTVLLDTGRSPHLAAGGDGNRTRCYQNKIRDGKTVRV